MIVISDSTPLITLMKADRLDVLYKLFGEVIIPDAVYRELTANPCFPHEAEQIMTAAFIKVVSVTDSRTVSVLRRATGLDLGESEAIVYADENHADLILMDEVSGRRVATDMGLKIMGSIGVLVAAYREGCLNQAEVEESFRKIRSANRHVSESLIRDALEIIRDK